MSERVAERANAAAVSPIDEVSNRFVRAAAALSPMLAVYVGLPSE